MGAVKAFMGSITEAYVDYIWKYDAGYREDVMDGDYGFEHGSYEEFMYAWDYIFEHRHSTVENIRRGIKFGADERQGVLIACALLQPDEWPEWLSDSATRLLVTCDTVIDTFK